MRQRIFAQNHRQRIRLLARRTARAPHQERPPRCRAKSVPGALAHQKIEVPRLAKKIRLIGRHHIDQVNQFFLQPLPENR